jgi:general secretion pathway protein H
MRISTSVTAARPDRRAHCIRRMSSSGGFTLLEVLVVMTLMAAITTLVMVGLLRGNVSGEPSRQQALRLQDVMILMSEQSMFRGQLLALRLQTQGWEPLVYDPTVGDFIPMGSPLGPVILEPSLQIEWLLAEQRDRDQVQIADVGEQLFSEAREESGKDAIPQVFFFPSGEVSPLTVLIRDQESGVESRLDVDALGRVSIPEEEQ